MNFEVSTKIGTEPASRSAICRVDLFLLRELLHLPSTVTITGARLDPSNSLACILELRSPDIPEGAEEVTAHLKFRVHRLPEFDRFEAVVRA